MAPQGTRTIIWAGGEHDFCLAQTGLIFGLEEKCDAGIAAIMKRLEDGSWRLNDVREPIRLGLIGGGLKPEEAMGLVKAFVDPPRPLNDSVLLAYEVLASVMVGVPGDPVGKGKPAEAAAAGSSMTTVASADLK